MIMASELTQPVTNKWKTKRLKFCLQSPLQYGANEPGESSDPEEPRFIRITDLAENGKLRADTFRSLEYEKAKDFLLEDGDILLARSGATVGKTFMYKNEWGVSCYAGYLIRARLDKTILSPSYASYFLSSRVYWEWVRSIYIQATIQNVSAEKYANLDVPIPPIPEQQSIANFLDKKTKQIDDLIEQKEKLLALLTEKRIAIITQAVTKGLDPKAKMKDSGVEWLGEVPEHWDLRRLRFLAYINPVKSELKEPDDVLVSFVPMEAVGEYGGLTLETEKEISEVYTGYTYFRNNDVVVAKITPCFENGKGALASDLKNGIAFGTTELHVLRGELLESRYLFYLSICDFFRKTGEAWMYGAGGQKRVPEEFLKDLIVPMPPPREQKEIGEWLETRIESFHASQNAIETSIEKLKEYRDALITSAITGQIDVRNT